MTYEEEGKVNLIIYCKTLVDVSHYGAHFHFFSRGPHVFESSTSRRKSILTAFLITAVHNKKKKTHLLNFYPHRSVVKHLGADSN